MSAAGLPGQQPEPWPDFPGLIASLLAKGYTRNPCLGHCPDREREHEHLKADGQDYIIWADGSWSPHDLTQPARIIYPAARGMRRR